MKGGVKARGSVCGVFLKGEILEVSDPHTCHTNGAVKFMRSDKTIYILVKDSNYSLVCRTPDWN